MFCALFIPDFHLQAALRYRVELWKQPVAVVDSGAVMELTPAAVHAGVQAGMNPTQALARCLTVQLVNRAQAVERSVTETLRGIACSASAYIEQTAENVCTLDLKGCRATGFAEWGLVLVRRLAALQIQAKAGIAENPDLALLAAQSATFKEPVCVVKKSASFLSVLPVSVLQPASEWAAVLEGWGIRTLGELTRLKKSDIAARLGPDGVRLWEQACGHSMRLLRLVRSPDCYEEAFDFERELDTAQPLLFMLRRFVDQLSGRLEAEGLVAAELSLTLPLSDGSRYGRIFQIPSPTANADVLFRILETHFEDLQLENAPTGVRLVAEPAKPEHQQFQLFENAVRDPNRFAETLARIMAVVGSENVGIPERKPTHQPDQFTLKMPGGEMDEPNGRDGQASRQAAGGVGLPLRRFRPPFPAQVSVEVRPRYIVSEQAHGAVADALGPYRISGQWWEAGWAAEEWDVQMACGDLYRISRHGETWQVEGCYER